MYNRFENGIHPREPLGDLLAATTEHTQSLTDQADYLTKVVPGRRITWLKGELERRGRNASRKAADGLCDNRILDAAQQNEGKVESLGVLGMQEIEESLVSVGALPVTHEADSDVTSDKIAPDTNFINPSHLIHGGGKKLMVGVAGGGGGGGAHLNQLLSHQALRAVSPELASVALDWKTFRNVKECSCSTPFDHFSRKSVFKSQPTTKARPCVPLQHHCWRCGEVFCTRCIDKKTALPGHFSQQPVPVCRPCYKDVTRSVSVDTP
ncbi:hypothetical protein E2C01_033180 [Portunus trituberculatus]|uniref:FYVE-type domain-containing protein n=1 Tax=Portunus trituberculatus TaxID=210409 RepID=A0A5B7F4W6_PORTR|nr:hypothetical protein [Portunus trituberculatus]